MTIRSGEKQKDSRPSTGRSSQPIRFIDWISFRKRIIWKFYSIGTFGWYNHLMHFEIGIPTSINDLFDDRLIRFNSRFRLCRVVIINGFLIAKNNFKISTKGIWFSSLINFRAQISSDIPSTRVSMVSIVHIQFYKTKKVGK